MSENIGRKLVLFIGPLPPPITGQSLACEVFLTALKEVHNVIVVDINKSDFASGGFAWRRVKDIILKIARIRNEARRADVVYFTVTESFLGNIKDLLIYIVCWRLLPRTVIHLHGGAGMIRLLQGGTGLLGRLNAYFLRRMAVVIVLGSRLRAVFAGVVPQDQIRIVENFSEDAYQLPNEKVVEKFGCNSPLRILYLSNMIAEKGYLLLRDAVLQIQAKRPGSVEMDFAGGFVTDSERAEFLASIAGLPMIRYHGIVCGEEKRHLLERAHVLALPTFYPFEGQPICILEAYASGCAVITTDHSGIFDVFTPGLNGWEVTKQCSGSIYAALLECLDNRDTVALVAQRNAALAQARFTTQRYNDELLAIVENAISRPL